MGVPSLWQLIDKVKQPISLSELAGHKIAVDMSTWIVESKLIATATGYRNIYLRNLFLRTLDFLKCGIKPVFVTDGKVPEIKESAMYQRRMSCKRIYAGPILRERSQSCAILKCLDLLRYLGVPCLASDGEAEALCAQLNQKGIVDGCLTSDSDILLYGARKVYRNYSKRNKQCLLESYSASDIFEEFGLDQRSMIGLALLVGCDYNRQGVKGVGFKAALRLLKELQDKNFDVLQRISCWRNSDELDELKKQRVVIYQETHCSNCLHKVKTHGRSRCKICKTKKDLSTTSENCTCICHQTLPKLISHEAELEVRDKALLDHNFPSQTIIAEFLGPIQTSQTTQEIQWQEPNLSELQKFVGEHLFWTGEVLFDKMVPLFIYWKLHSFPYTFLESLKPQRVIRKCKRNHHQVYEVEWSKMNQDIWTKAQVYTNFVNRQDFSEHFSDIANMFEDLQTDGSKKQKIEDTTAEENVTSPAIDNCNDPGRVTEKMTLRKRYKKASRTR